MEVTVLNKGDSIVTPKFSIIAGVLCAKNQNEESLYKDIFSYMKENNIKRIIFKTKDKLKVDLPFLTEIRDVKSYIKVEGIFKEEDIPHIYQIYNKNGSSFVNGPFQRCKICGNWFKISDEEKEFMNSRMVSHNRMCKRCKGRKVLVY